MSRYSFVVQGDAPQSVHDLARQMEQAFNSLNINPTAGPYTARSELIDRMTDAETDDFETQLDLVSSRLRQKYYAVSAIYHRADDFGLLRDAMIAVFGEARTAELLKPSR